MNLSFGLLATVLGAACATASATVSAADYKIVDTIAIGGAARWDYLYVDSAAQRLYVTHGTQTEVIDTRSDKIIGTIADTQGVHGVAIATDLGLGFTSNGATDTVAIFDLTTLKITGSVKVGSNPDAIVYAPLTHKIVTFNGKSANASIIDAKTMQVVATVPVGGKPEFAVIAADGNAWFNIEDTAQIAKLNLFTNKMEKPHSLKPCDEPTGLAIDAKQRLYSVCSNNLMIVTGLNGKMIAQTKIGSGPDGVVVLDEQALSANGQDGTLSAVGEVNGKFVSMTTIATQKGARTIAADPATHRLYLPTADFLPATGQDRPKGVVDTFRVLVLEKR